MRWLPKWNTSCCLKTSFVWFNKWLGERVESVVWGD